MTESAFKNKENGIFIPGNVPSSKNSKQWTGKFLVWSKTAQQYVKDTAIYWKQYKLRFENEILINYNNKFPIRVSFEYHRKSRHKFDYINPTQTLLDLMVKYNWIEDDNADVIIPVFKPYVYNKENPGVYIKIMNKDG
jgi:hypothetical protein